VRINAITKNRVPINLADKGRITDPEIIYHTPIFDTWRLAELEDVNAFRSSASGVPRQPTFVRLRSIYNLDLFISHGRPPCLDRRFTFVGGRLQG
jgi:hypothetical protein